MRTERRTFGGAPDRVSGYPIHARHSLTFMGGVLVAVALGLAGSLAFGTLSAVLGSVAALKIVIAALGLAYLLYLLSRGRVRVGRVALLALWACAAGAAWLFAPSLGLYFAVHVALVWLVRSLCFYSGVFPALMDLGLSVCSGIVAVWAANRSGSAFLSIWCFFLVQALAAQIPARIEPRPASGPEGDAFERAQRMAETAIGRLAARR